MLEGVQVINVGTAPARGSKIVTAGVDVTDQVGQVLAKYMAAQDKEQIRLIGQDLHDAGGLGCMQVAFYAALPHMANRREHGPQLQFWWDGIGEWRS